MPHTPGVHVLGFSFLGLMLAGNAAGQPVITSISSTLVHQGAATISGSRFGSKPTAAPSVWDDSSGSGSDIRSKWSGGWPDCSSNLTYNIAYRTPMRGITLPHQRVGRYIAGAHAEELGFCGGQDVMLYQTFTGVSRPLQVYASWYQRADDNWVFGLGSPADDNYKEFNWTTDASPYGNDEFYTTYNPSPTSRTGGLAWAVSPGMGRASTIWGNSATNPMAGAWTKVEHIMRFSAANDGRMQIIDDGVTTVDYTGATDTSPGTTRTLGIGGYARSRNPNNWRYFTDVYVDTSWARVILGNAATLAASTRREMQIPVSWTDTAVAVTLNLGAFSQGQTAYLYVVDSNGTVNAAGYPVVVGGSSPPPPTPPKNVRIIR